jgi:hypothetical protein
MGAKSDPHQRAASEITPDGHSLEVAWKNRFERPRAPLPRIERSEESEGSDDPASDPVPVPLPHFSIPPPPFRGTSVIVRSGSPDLPTTLPLALLTLLGLVDDRSTAREIIDASGLDDAVALDALTELFERKLVRCRD